MYSAYVNIALRLKRAVIVLTYGSSARRQPKSSRANSYLGDAGRISNAETIVAPARDCQEMTTPRCSVHLGKANVSIYRKPTRLESDVNLH
jgi:hypothetical protein